MTIYSHISNLRNRVESLSAKLALSSEPLARHLQAIKNDMEFSIVPVQLEAIVTETNNEIDESEPSFQRLLKSIREHGQIVPGLLMPRYLDGQGPYLTVVCGRKRLAVARILNRPFYATVRMIDKQQAKIIREEQRLTVD